MYLSGKIDTAATLKGHYMDLISPCSQARSALWLTPNHGHFKKEVALMDKLSGAQS